MSPYARIRSVYMSAIASLSHVGVSSCSRVSDSLQRNIPMLLRRVLVAFGLEHLQCVDQLLAGILGTDHGVNVTAFGGHVRIGKAFAEFFYLFASRFGDDVSLLFLRLCRERRPL